MNRPNGLTAVALAALVSAATLSSALALGRVVRTSALRVSRQQPTADTWVEPRVEDSPLLIRQGRKTFLESCAHCHGADATGDEGPDLHGLQVSDRYIAHLIAYGVPHQMPAFGSKLHRGDIRALTSYLRSLLEDGG